MRYLFLISILIACSSATEYQKKKKGEGYVDSKQGDLYSTEFHANSHTKLKDALAMAQYRATEVCAPQQSYFIGSEDHSRVRNVTKTSGSYPYYNTGYYPYRRGWSLGVGFGSYFSESWEDKIVYPKLKVIYICDDQFFAPEGEFKTVSAKELSYVYQDLLGAIVVEDKENSSVLKKGDIILRVEGSRMENLSDFYYLFHRKRTLPLEILRDGKRLSVKVEAINVTEKVTAFNEEVKKRMCKADKKYCSKED